MVRKQQVKKQPEKRVVKAKRVAKPKPVARQKAAAKQKPMAKPKPVAKQKAAATQKPVAKPKPIAKEKPAAKQKPAAKEKPLAKEKPAVKEKRVAKEEQVDTEKLSTMTTERVKLKRGYKPRKNEEYMCPEQLEYFRQKLLTWRQDLIEESRETITHLQHEVRDVGDEAERATRETENSLELRTRDRYRKLIRKIDKALNRIEEGDYGYCEETGEEIGIERLEARPIATLCLDAQERWELRQRQLGETR